MCQSVPLFCPPVHSTFLRISTTTNRDVFELQQNDQTFALNTRNPNWEAAPFDTQHTTGILYSGEERKEAPWRIDRTFFDHFPRLHGLKVPDRDLPPKDVLNHLKVVDLRFGHANLRDASAFELLPSFANVRALVIDCTNRHEHDTAELAQLLTPLASFDKLQALYLRLLPDCWSEANLKTLKNVVCNNKALREIALYCEGSNTQSASATPALYDTLSEHPFSHLLLKGFDIKTLHFLDVSPP